jgi:hypothetical protein
LITRWSRSGRARNTILRVNAERHESHNSPDPCGAVVSLMSLDRDRGAEGAPGSAVCATGIDSRFLSASTLVDVLLQLAQVKRWAVRTSKCVPDANVCSSSCGVVRSLYEGRRALTAAIFVIA